MVAWRDRRGPAVDALLAALDSRSPDVRVSAIQALQKLGARKALPRLRALTTDAEREHVDRLITVGEAARAAVAAVAAR